MKNILFLFIVCLTLITGCAHKQTNAKLSDNNSRMLRDFYTFYIGTIANSSFKDAPGLMEKRLDSIKHAYCTDKVLKQIKRLKSVDELDADPIIYAQGALAGWINTLAVKKDSGKQNQYTVTYSDRDSLNYKANYYTIHLTLLNGKIDSLSGKWEEIPIK